MKYIIAFVMALCCSSAAQAVMVSNLDDIDHVVIFQTTEGSQVIKTIAPGQTITHMIPTGIVRIKGSEHKVHVYPNDRLAIWDQGRIQIQMRRQLNGRN